MVIDVQGFTVKSKFIPRELAASGVFGFNFRIDLDTNIKIEELDPFDQRQVSYQTRWIHGMYPNSDSPTKYPAEHMPSIIRMVYSLNMSEDKPFMACSNDSMALILNSLEIPFVNLLRGEDRLNRFREVDGYNTLCEEHVYNNRQFTTAYYRCAKEKSEYLWRCLSVRVSVAPGNQQSGSLNRVRSLSPLSQVSSNTSLEGRRKGRSKFRTKWIFRFQDPSNGKEMCIWVILQIFRQE